jgi:L-asparagine transporter-like permease
MESSQESKKTNIKKAAQQPLTKRNFIMMAIAGAMIVIGFLLMLGSSSTTEAYNPDIFSTRRIVIGPLFAFLGFAFMGVAIILRPNKTKK